MLHMTRASKMIAPYSHLVVPPVSYYCIISNSSSVPITISTPHLSHNSLRSGWMWGHVGNNPKKTTQPEELHTAHLNSTLNPKFLMYCLNCTNQNVPLHIGLIYFYHRLPWFFLPPLTEILISLSLFHVVPSTIMIYFSSTTGGNQNYSF